MAARAARNRLRYDLDCGHCGARFSGTYHQRKHSRSRNGTVPYCSDACRQAATRKRMCKPIPEMGPCPTCSKMFHSRRPDKIFCSMDCYLDSPQLKRMLRKNLEKIADAECRARIADTLCTGRYIPCLECGKEIYQKNKGKNKFCGQVCYRAFMAKRFDRWVANPEDMALPQCFDEFLDQEELPCLLGGCDWAGKHLSMHVNFAHGIKASEFKRAAGFNLGTGVISKDLAQWFQQRDWQGLATPGVDGESIREKGALAMAARARDREAPTIRYISLESREHQRKARVFLPPGPERDCIGCGRTFRQSTPMGRQMYCSKKCRSDSYTRKQKQKAKTRSRRKDGTFVWLDASGGD